MSRFVKWLDRSLNAFSPLEAARLHVLLLAIGLITVVGLISLGYLWRGRKGGFATRRHGLAVFGATPLCIGFLCFLDAVFVEPGWLDVTRQTVQTERLPSGKHLRIALMSDLHVAGWNRMLRQLPDTVNAEHPDLILYAGDSLNALEALPVFRSILSAMHATYGVYAVRGNHDLEVPNQGAALFEGGVARELQERPVLTADGQVALCGAPWTPKGPPLQSCLEQAPPGVVRIALYHTPDLVSEAVAGGADLYLAGHTHGGQFRLPYYGAIITMSAYDKKYEAGRYQVGDTTMYVTRGIGVEGRMIPLRFFCRPELTIIDLEGTGPAPAHPAPTVQADPQDGGRVE